MFLNNITLGEILIILLIHWYADFVLQTDFQAKNKSKSLKALLSHTIVYSLFTGFCYFMWFPTSFHLPNITQCDPGYLNIILFTLITFGCHTITDYITSRLNTYLWNKGDVHNFFVSVGFDQYLHYLQLFITYSLLR